MLWGWQWKQQRVGTSLPTRSLRGERKAKHALSWSHFLATCDGNYEAPCRFSSVQRICLYSHFSRLKAEQPPVWTHVIMMALSLFRSFWNPSTIKRYISVTLTLWLHWTHQECGLLGDASSIEDSGSVVLPLISHRLNGLCWWITASLDCVEEEEEGLRSRTRHSSLYRYRQRWGDLRGRWQRKLRYRYR